jgi:hypothetical protein
MRKKPKPNEPSVRDKLSAKFDADLLADYEAHGREAIAATREKYPEKWVDVVHRRIGATELKDDGYENCQSWEDIARKNLKSVGVIDEIITPHVLERAIAANDRFVAEMQQIRAEAEGVIQ